MVAPTARTPGLVANRVVAWLPISPALLLLIAGGASVGTTCRWWLGALFPSTPGAWPAVTFGINIVGSFLLGLLLESLAETGPDTGWRRGLRLGLGTGLLGGFTTYSTFSMDAVNLVRAGFGWLAVAYAWLSVTLGIMAASLAMWGTRRVVQLVRQRSSGRSRS